MIPKTDDAFTSSANMGLYFQIYNFILDQQSLRPGIEVEYGIAVKGSEPESWRDVSSSVQFAGTYCRLARMINLSRLKPGDYEVRIRVLDKVSGQSSTAVASFRITS